MKFTDVFYNQHNCDIHVLHSLLPRLDLPTETVAVTVATWRKCGLSGANTGHEKESYQSC